VGAIVFLAMVVFFLFLQVAILWKGFM